MAKEIMKGNHAVAEAAIRAGLECFFAYPITPASEIPEYLAIQHKEGRLRVFLQGESEVSVINMVIGGASTGARTMTASSSPGVSLMLEGISYAAGMDLPIVLINSMRGGPGLADIFPSQEDYIMSAKGGGHGGYKSIVLAPSSVKEMAELTYDVFNLAEKYRMPSVLLYDGLLGQLTEGMEFPEPRIERYAPDWAIQGMSNRKKEVYESNTQYTKRPSDLEAIFYEIDQHMLKQGRKKGADKPNTLTSLYIDDKNFFEELKDLRDKKFRYIQQHEVRVEKYLTDDADFVVVAFGIPARIAKESVETARAKNIKAGLLRPITLSPFPYDEISKTARTAKAFLTVELNKGQMLDDVKVGVNGKAPVQFYGRCGGNIPNEDEILGEIIKLENIKK